MARFLVPYRWRVVAAMLALIVAAVSVLALGQGLKVVIDNGFGSRDAAQLNSTLAFVIGVAVVMSLATFARFHLMMSTGERVIADIRRAVFGHILTLSATFFESTRTGEIVSRVTNDLTVLQTVIGWGLSMFLRFALMMAGAAVMLVITSPKLAAMTLVGVPIALVPILLVGRRVRRHARESQDRVADVSAYLDEALHEIRTVQAYGHEAEDRRLFGSHAEAAYEAGVRRVRDRALLIASVMLISFCAVGVILWIGGHDVLAGGLTPGELSAFVFYSAIVANGAGAMSEVWGDMLRAAGATERIVEMLETRSTLVSPAQPCVLPARVKGAVMIDSLSFAYPGREALALDDFSMEIAPGERIALVGPSGAGKSTVLALLLRFYNPGSGCIRIDGIDIGDCDPLEVRRHIALVPQDPVIFAASVTENVRYGRPGASIAQVRAACEAAQALEFIEGLPQGLDSQLGERGVRLSGGQRQRLSIARALLADREILLLDEATSSLDAESERAVGVALERLARGRATLVIAHRLATVKKANRIVVMDRGRAHAVGTHESLLREDGLYAHLARLQFLDNAAIQEITR
ncbi:MAG: ATP-binding cassette domain-containing protein [Betaproteobacteria bacterium]|nr:ATP-binding cassette domain-containing protein [Betaproteobacteria bacterium]